MSSVTSGLSSIPPVFNTPLEPQQGSEDTATGSPTQPDEYVDYCALRLEAALEDGPSAIEWWCEPRQRARFPKLCKTAVEVLLSIPAMSAEPERLFFECKKIIISDLHSMQADTLEGIEGLKSFNRRRQLLFLGTKLGSNFVMYALFIAPS